jgi:DNA-binding transcriptional ArsR family regulator
MKPFLWGVLLIALTAFAETPDPFATSSKVQSDLENLLSRVIPEDKFLVQVNTEVSTRTERRVVEGDQFITPPEPKEVTAAPMPGFYPETVEKVESPAPPTRQTFRMLEIPELRAVRVSVGFDEAIARDTLRRAEFLVRAYMQSNFKALGSVSFATVPMIKTEKEVERELASEKEKAEKEKAEREKAEKEKQEKPLSESEILWSYVRWAIFGILVALLLLNVRRPRETVSAAPRRSTGSKDDLASKNSLAGLLGGRNPFELSRPVPPYKEEAPEPSAAELRKRALERFITRSQAFRQYYTTLSREAADELYSCVSGPAMDRLLTGLALSRPSDNGPPSNIEEILEHHLKEFEEYVQAKDWQDRQFFGFLQNLSNEQLATIVASQPPIAACVVIRMMQPKQSAAVLDLMSAGKRHEILSQVAALSEVAFSDIVSIEREIRAAAQQVPERFLGSTKEDADFWGNVVSESSDQDPIYDELEHTRPDIAPALKKFKFRLEEAASLPDSLLQKVLGAVDNEELCLALSTCSADVRDVLLDALSPSRRNVLMNLFPTYRGAPQDRAQPARARLTKRIREALA